MPRKARTPSSKDAPVGQRPTGGGLISQSSFQNGDLLAFSGVSAFSTIVKFWTSSTISHVGLTFWIEKPVRRLFVIESIEGRGVRLVPIEAWLRWNGTVQHYELQVGDGDRQKVIEAAFAQFMFAYASLHQLFRSFGFVTKPLLRLFGDPADTDPTRVHCAEFVMNSLRGAGVLYPGKEPAEFSPGEVAQLDIFKLRPDSLKELKVE